MVGISIVSSLVFAAVGYGVAKMVGFSSVECFIVGTAMMFSSTIIGLKLLPTTVLHHQHTGELMISVLLMQDVIAIVVLMLLNGVGKSGLSVTDILMVVLALPTLIAFSFLVEKYILVKLLSRFESTQEYVFLLSIGWCLGIAQLGSLLGLSEEIGAFIAGVAIAASPISLYIAESLQPLRDFFLVLFFFSIGARFNLLELPQVIVPASILAGLILMIKPLVYAVSLRLIGENKSVSNEVGIRLGQASEFSLLVGALAVSTGLLSTRANLLVQATTILTFIVSSYWVVLRYPTPIALSEKMHRD